MQALLEFHTLLNERAFFASLGEAELLRGRRAVLVRRATA